MNAPIQGLAADIFKVALVRLDAALEQSELRAGLILQVHDEVIVEVPPDERDGRREAGARRDVRCVRPARAARGQPVARRLVGRGQGLNGSSRPSGHAARHWFEDLADHLGPAYLRYSLHDGHRAGSRVPGRRARSEPGDDGAGRRMRARAPRGGARRAWCPGRSVSTSVERFVDLATDVAASARASPTGAVPPRRCADDGRTIRRFDGRSRGVGVDAAISLCQGAFGLGGPADAADPQNLGRIRPCWPGSARRSCREDGWPCRRSRPTSR